MARQGERLSRTWGPPDWESAWRAALLAACILSPCFQPTGAQSTINVEVTVVPSRPTVGQSIILTPGGAPNFDSCSWYRGATTDTTKRIFTYYPPPNPQQQNGAEYTGREAGEPGCAMRIGNLRAGDSGTYTVSKSGRAIPQEEGRVAIVVSEDVFNITISGPSRAFENAAIVLHCTSEDTRVSYYWLKGTQSPEAAGHISLSNNNQTLTFHQVLRGDSGNYACYVYNSSHKVGVFHRLDVIYGPDVPVISPTDQDYPVGGTLDLSCNADSNPPAQYAWLIDGIVVQQHTSQLLLYNLSLNNSGTYTCSAVNSETGASNVSKEITVWEKLPSPVLWPADSVVMESAKVTLNCSTSVGVVSWFKDGKPFTAQLVQVLQNQTLSLAAVTKDDTGVYLCEGRNPVSSAMSNPSNLIVAYGPDSVALNQEGTMAHELGSHLPLVCTADSSPVVRFQWLFNGAEQNVTGNSFGVQLEDWEDQGNYTCQATNPFTRRSASASVQVTLTKESAHLDAGAIAGIVVGSLAATGLVVGTLLYFLLRLRGQKSKKTHTPDVPTISPYEHIFPRLTTSVRPDTGPVSRHVYEDLQHGSQPAYETMRGIRGKLAKKSSPAPVR